MRIKKVAGLGGGGEFACYYGNELMETSKKATRCEGRCRAIVTARKATPKKSCRSPTSAI